MNCPHCGAENEAAAEACTQCGDGLLLLGVGSVLADRYEILSVLGAGALGRVYRARDRMLEETVALKVLHPEATHSPEIARRFRSEVKLARKVRHVNVCAFHEYGEHGPLRFVSMELVDGVDLHREIREKGPLPPREAFDVAIQVAKGLEAIHAADVLHRDLKTSNIMRDARGYVRLLDFGIAKRATPSGTLALTGVEKVVGTPEYMSPEQIRGEDLDARSDLYSLGIVIFELFTAGVPFRGRTPLDTMLRHVNEPPPLYGERAARLSPSLVPILVRLLAKDRRERPSSAREVVEELRLARATAFPEAAATPPELPALRPKAPPKPEPVVRTEVLPKAAGVAPGTRRPTPPPVPAIPARDAAAASALDASRTYIELPPGRAPAAGAAGLRPPPVSGPVQAARPSGRFWLVGLGMLVVLVAAVAVILQLAKAQRRTTEVTATVVPSPTPELPAVAQESPPPIATPEASPPAPLEAAAPSMAPPESSPAPTAEATPDTLSVPTPSPEPRRRRVRSTPAPTPEPTPTPTPRAVLAVLARSGTEIEIDGKATGQAPLEGIELEPGTHVVRLTHPEYWPLVRPISLASGQSLRLDVDLAWEAVPRRGVAPYRMTLGGRPSDPYLERGVSQVVEGDYRGAILTLEPVIKRLTAKGGNRKELAAAEFYLGVANLELNRQAAAKASFLSALEHDGGLKPNPAAFSAKVLGFFNTVKASRKER